MLVCVLVCVCVWCEGVKCVTPARMRNAKCKTANDAAVVAAGRWLHYQLTPTRRAPHFRVEGGKLHVYKKSKLKNKKYKTYNKNQFCQRVTSRRSREARKSARCQACCNKRWPDQQCNKRQRPSIMAMQQCSNAAMNAEKAYPASDILDGDLLLLLLVNELQARMSVYM